MRKSMRYVLTAMVLVLCIMAGYVFLGLLGLHARTADVEVLNGAAGEFLGAEEVIPVMGRGWIAVVCAALGLVGLAWTLTAERPQLHWAALAILLPAGVMIALCKPAMAWYAWDEETHYGVMQALIGSEGATLTERVNAMSLWDVGYLPTIVGMALARVLGLDGVLEYKLGVLLNAAVYAGMCTLAVKHAPKYKLTFLMVSAAPVALFQAASCTYDGTVIASVLLAVALLAEEWMRPGRLTGPRALTMVALLTLGTVSKPAYSLLLLLLLTMPEEKFGSSGRAWLWRGFILLMTVWALLSLLMPGTYDNVKNGDDRFSGADSHAQLRFVLENPGEAMQILGEYIRDYWRGLHVNDLSHWGYLGLNSTINRAFAWGILLACPLCVLGEDDRRSPLKASRRAVLLALEILVLLVLVITQFMVSTPVGDHFIQGAQPRYSMPVWVLLALGLMWPDALRRRVKPVGRLLTVCVAFTLAVVTYGYAGQFLFGVIAGMA